MFWNKKKEEAREIIRELSQTFSAVKSETEITPKVQSEYIAYHDKVDADAYSEKYVLAESEKLSNENAPENEKKRILFLLGHIGTLPCVKILEEFVKKAEGEIKQWAALTLEEGWMFLESEEMGTNKGRIFSGAGGENDKMRYYFSIRSRNKEPFNKEQEELIRNKAGKVAEQEKLEIESIEFNGDALLASVLVSIDVAVGEMIEKIIRTCNLKNKILYSRYFVTNEKKPTWEELGIIPRCSLC